MKKAHLLLNLADQSYLTANHLLAKDRGGLGTGLQHKPAAPSAESAPTQLMCPSGHICLPIH